MYPTSPLLNRKLNFSKRRAWRTTIYTQILNRLSVQKKSSAIKAICTVPRLICVDHVSANLSFENGVERYYDIRQNARTRSKYCVHHRRLVGRRVWHAAATNGSIIGDATGYFRGFRNAGQNPTAIYRFNVSEEESLGELEVGSDHYRVPFTTDVWISVLGRDSQNSPKINRHTGGNAYFRNHLGRNLRRCRFERKVLAFADGRRLFR